jgi:hypothetical protein
MNAHLGTNEKSLPIQWTELPTGTLVGAGSFWPMYEGQVLKFFKQVIERGFDSQRFNNALEYPPVGGNWWTGCQSRIQRLVY